MRMAIVAEVFLFIAEDGIRDRSVTEVQTCALLISSRRRHTRLVSDWSSDVCSSDLLPDGERHEKVTGDKSRQSHVPSLPEFDGARRPQRGIEIQRQAQAEEHAQTNLQLRVTQEAKI